MELQKSKDNLKMAEEDIQRLEEESSVSYIYFYQITKRPASNYVYLFIEPGIKM